MRSTTLPVPAFDSRHDPRRCLRSLSLSIFFPAGWMVVQWVDQQSRKIIDRMVWREPVASWEQSPHFMPTSQWLFRAKSSHGVYTRRTTGRHNVCN